MAGLWEFPGGKVEEGESLENALVRELEEELGITARVGKELASVTHSETGLEILLEFFEVSIIAGDPQALEEQEILWVRPNEMRNLPMPPADDEIVELVIRTMAP
jgi:mutator protein MutT